MGLDGYKHKRNLNAGSRRFRGRKRPDLCDSKHHAVQLLNGDLQIQLNFAKQECSGTEWIKSGFWFDQSGASWCYNPLHVGMIRMYWSWSITWSATTPKVHKARIRSGKVRDCTFTGTYAVFTAWSSTGRTELRWLWKCLKRTGQEDEDYQSPLDILFERLEMQDEVLPLQTVLPFISRRPERPQVYWYQLVSVWQLLTWNRSSIDLHGRTGFIQYRGKSSTVCCIPDADTVWIIVGMIYSNLFQTLYYVADRKYRLPIRYTVLWMNSQT